jgi:hypothetical protein
MDQLPDRPPPELTLRLLRVGAPVAALLMAVLVAVGLLTAPQGAVAALLDNVWGRVTIADLYLGLLATWSWIAWRERNVGPALLWAVLLVVTGSIALWTYISVQAHAARDVPELLLGSNEIGG